MKKELGTSLGKTDQDLIKGLVNFRKGLTSVVGSALGGMDEQDLNRYFETGGADIKPRTSPLEKYLPGAEKQAQPEPIKINYAKDKPMYRYVNGQLQKAQ